jgi:hypothetical protein
MSDIRVQAFAEKVVNKGGGWKGKKEWRVTKEVIQGKEEDVHEQVYVEVKTSGSDYIVYNCPVCQKRNKRCAYDAKVEDEGNVLVFRCNGCLRMVEVKRPINLTIPSENMVLTPGQLKDRQKRG